MTQWVKLPALQACQLEFEPKSHSEGQELAPKVVL